VVTKLASSARPENKMLHPPMKSPEHPRSKTDNSANVKIRDQNLADLFISIMYLFLQNSKPNILLSRFGAFTAVHSSGVMGDKGKT